MRFNIGATSKHFCPTRLHGWLQTLPLLALLFQTCPLSAQGPLRIATFNLENYVVRPTGNRKVKPAESRAQIVQSLVALHPDVVALQEIGDTDSLAELQARLKAAGLDLPHAEHVRGFDTNIFVAVLSRFPFLERRPHTNDSYLVAGRRLRSSRGIAEVTLEPRPGYRITLFTTHLKSKRAVGTADESEMRAQEALLLRRKIDALLARNPEANVVVCGDFNDSKDAPPIKTLLGKGTTGLIDTRPAERPAHPGTNPSENDSTRPTTWTHYYSREDSYSRLDYIRISRGLAREWNRSGSCVLASPDWGLASDHRPVVAEFETRDR